MIRVTPERKCISFLMPKTTCVHNEVCSKYCYLNKRPYPQSVMDEINNEKLEEKKTAELFNDWDGQFENFLKIYNSFEWAEMAGKFRVVLHTMGDFPMSAEYLLAVMKLVDKYGDDFDFVVFTRHRPSSELPIWDILDDKLKMWISLDSLLYYEQTWKKDRNYKAFDDIWPLVLTDKDSLYENGYKGGVAQRYHSERELVHFGGKESDTCLSCNIFKTPPCTQKGKFHLFMTEPVGNNGIDVKLSDIIPSDFDALEKKFKESKYGEQKIKEEKQADELARRAREKTEAMEARRAEKKLRSENRPMTEENLREYLKDVEITPSYSGHRSDTVLTTRYGEEHMDGDHGYGGC